MVSLAVLPHLLNRSDIFISHCNCCWYFKMSSISSLITSLKSQWSLYHTLLDWMQCVNLKSIGVITKQICFKFNNYTWGKMWFNQDSELVPYHFMFFYFMHSHALPSWEAGHRYHQTMKDVHDMKKVKRTWG